MDVPETQPARRRASKSLKVGIVDLVERQPSHTIYGRVLNANFASIMPQVVAVWAERMGHKVEYVTYTGFEDLRRELPRGVDILFVNAFTQAAYLAYSVSNLYRKQGVVTVLGGPHARAYAEDARDYFDYLVGLADQQLICDLLRDFSPNPKGGVALSARQQPAALPGVRERWKYVQKTLEKTWILHIVQILGSLGCPYKCDFCIDAEMDHQTLPYDQLREDLAFLQSLPSPPRVGWVDPNFGVRFDEYMNVIESAVRPGRLQFAAESSLSLLREPHLKRLKENHFVMMLPGIESWFDYNDKARQGRHVGMEKVKAVAEHVNLVMRYVPYLQTNFIFGWDSDAGAEPEWSRNSCSPPVVILEKTAEALATADRILRTALLQSRDREEQKIVLALVVSLLVVVFQEFGHNAPQRVLPEQDQLGQAFLLDRTDPAFRVGVQIGTSRWDRRALHTADRECLPKLAAELLVAIVQQVTTTVQVSCILHRCVTRHLLHPARVRGA
jgi:hypothetical protein